MLRLHLEKESLKLLADRQECYFHEREKAVLGKRLSISIAVAAQGFRCGEVSSRLQHNLISPCSTTIISHIFVGRRRPKSGAGSGRVVNAFTCGEATLQAMQAIKGGGGGSDDNPAIIDPAEMGGRQTTHTLQRKSIGKGCVKRRPQAEGSSDARTRFPFLII